MSGRVLLNGERIWQNLQSPPASSLTVAGGFCHATSPGSVFKDIFSWGQCVAETQGEQKNGSHTVTLTSSIQNVSARNGKNLFTAGQLKLGLTSYHPAEGQPSIVPTEVVFGPEGNMFLNEQSITLTTDLRDFQTMATLDDFDSKFQRDPETYKKYHDRFLTREGKMPEWKQPIPRVSGGYVVCSIVSSVRWGSNETPGNVLHHEGFGSIYFGEVIMNETSRRYTLVRLAMGSDVKAEVAYAEGDSNGGTLP
jgi:hypothetical protein